MNCGLLNSMTRSALAMVSGRWAMTMRVMRGRAMAALTSRSRATSRWLVASSSSRMRGRRYSARASRTRCFLAAGEGGAHVAAQTVVAHGHGHDVVVDVRQAHRPRYLHGRSVYSDPGGRK
jgi:hypothetical protein